MLINECRYFFYNEDRVTTRCFDRIITITDDEEVTKELIWDINNRVINRILEIYPKLKADGYQGHVRLHDKDNNVKFITYSYNDYEIDNILIVNEITNYKNKYKRAKDNNVTIGLYNIIKQINSIGKTYRLSSTIFLCDGLGIVNYVVFNDEILKECGVKKVFETENFSHIIESVDKIYTLRRY